MKFVRWYLWFAAAAALGAAFLWKEAPVYVRVVLCAIGGTPVIVVFITITRAFWQLCRDKFQAKAIFKVVGDLDAEGFKEEGTAILLVYQVVLKKKAERYSALSKLGKDSAEQR